MPEQDVERVVDLLIKRMQGRLSVEENYELNSWMEEHPVLYGELTSDVMFDEIGEEYRAKERILIAIKERKRRGAYAEESLNLQERIKNKKTYLTTWRVAAAVMILAAVAIVVTLVNRKTLEGSREMVFTKKRTDLQPGGNKAVLTLAGGSSIILDNMRSGILSSEGGADVQKTVDGKLLYKAVMDGGTGSQGLAFNTLTTPKGGQYSLELSDGSKVWLNAASSLRYPVRFEGAERKVLLSGEAYFEIAKSGVSEKSPGKPFIVDVMPIGRQLKQARIEVLGTHFNINAYTDENAIKATLLEGSVRLHAFGGAGEHTVILRPGQEGQMSYTVASKGIKVINDADTESAVSWKYGITSFKNEDIKGIMRKVARWYDADVIFEGDIPERIFVGGISRSSNLSEVLKVLELNNIKFEVQGKKIIVRP